MIGKCSECGKRRKLYQAILMDGKTVMLCGECIAENGRQIYIVYGD